MTKLVRISCSILFLMSLAVCAQITLKRVPEGSSTTITTAVRNGVTLVSIPDFATNLGFRWQWDPFIQKITCTRNASKLIFTQDNVFYSHNSVIDKMAIAPRRLSGSLYLPLSQAITIFGNHLPRALSWSSSTKTLTYNTVSHTVSSVSFDQKANGTLITIALADSIPFDYTYFYPNFNLNFLGGTIDTETIKRGKRIGVVDSVFAVQFKKSAQLSLILCKEVEDPQIDYIQDTRTIMVSLRPKNANKKLTQEVIRQTNVKEEAVRRIVIDPGHGGKDPGAIGVSGIKEKDVVLSIALQLRDNLRKKSNFTIYMTRDKDVFIPLRDRTKFANENKADLFVSIHSNAVPGPKKRKESILGYKVFFLSQAKNEDDKLMAMRENAVIELEEKPQNYNNLHNVLIDLAGNEYLRESQDLCILFDKEFASDLSKKIPKLNLGVGQANFWVLNGAYMPSVLIETGFLSHSDEEKLLADKEFQKEMASSMCNAILEFKQRYETGL